MRFTNYIDFREKMKNLFNEMLDAPTPEIILILILFFATIILLAYFDPLNMIQIGQEEI